MAIRIPFNKPALTGKEFEYISEAIRRGQISGDGMFTMKCHNLLQEILSVEKVLLTTSCTHALEMAALLLNIEAGDHVIAPSFTFSSTVNAFVLRGAVPIFIDIRPDTLNFDENMLERLITARTRAIVVMHYAGVGCEMDTILKIAASHKIPVVEDNAHGLFGRYKGKHLGTFGCLAAQSFHETKNILCGEGGALLINDSQYVERAEIIREKGTDRTQFFRGQTDKYTWVDVGSSYLPSDILAAFLFAQLEERERTQSKRKRIWEYYRDNLAHWAANHQIQMPFVPDYTEQPYHMFYLIAPSGAIRNEIMGNLRAHGILSAFHYLPLHLSLMGRKFGGKRGDCPVTESVSERLLRLPFYSELGEGAQSEIVTVLQNWTLKR